MNGGIIQNSLIRPVKIAVAVLVWTGGTTIPGCHNPAGQSGAADTSVFVKVIVTDSAGNPVPFGHVTVATDPLPAIGPLRVDAAEAGGSWPGMILSLGADGTVVQELGVFPEGRITKLSGSVRAPGCPDDWAGTLAAVDYIVDGSRAQDTIHVSSIASTPFPVATIDSGQVCAWGNDATWGPWSFIFLMSIDSISNQQLAGRWTWSPLWTDVGDRGTFRGVHRPGFVVLDFESASPLLRCTGLRITVTLLPDGRWGESSVTGVPGPYGGCLVNAEIFTFGSGEVWPGAFPYDVAREAIRTAAFQHRGVIR